MSKRMLVLIILVFLLVIVYAGVIRLNINKTLEGLIDIELIAGCNLWIISPPLQPMKTVVLACPGRDAIRLWPLPIVDPWSEDWYEQDGTIITMKYSPDQNNIIDYRF